MVVAVVVTIYTAGAAGAALAAGEAAGSTWAAGGVANMAISQGVGSLAGSAASQLVATGSVDWNQAFKAGLTAGITAGLTNAPIFEGGDSLNQIAGVSDIGATGAKLAQFNIDNFGTNLIGIAGRGVVTAGVATAINGGSFEAALRNSVVSDLGAMGANLVGQATNPLTTENVLAHAAVGCATAAGQGKDCASGALGGATAAVVNPLIDPLTSQTDATNRTVEHVAGSMLAGGLLAESLGLGGVTAANAALNETLNNWLSKKPESLAAKSEQQRYDEASKACYGGDSSACATARSLAAISTRRDANLNAACSDIGSAACRDTIRLAQANGNQVILGKDGNFYVFRDTTGVLQESDRPSNTFQDQTAQGVTDLAIGEGLGYATGTALKAAGFVTSRLFSSSGGYLGEVMGGAKGGVELASLEAQNIANVQRLANDLRLQSANSPFAVNGTLTQDAINSSKAVPGLGPGQLSNPAIPSGFGKYTTETFQSPAGNFQMHFYKNPTTGEVFYGLDYKAVFNNMSGVPKP